MMRTGTRISRYAALAAVAASAAILFLFAPSATFAARFPSVPKYLGAADAGGSANSGTGLAAANNSFVSDSYAYTVWSGSATDCASAIGCEFKIFDISNPASPVYVGGADASGGTNSGTGNVNANEVFVSGSYAYTVWAGDATDCASAIGCELKVFDISNPASPTYVGGGDVTGAANSGVGNVNTNGITVSGNYAYTVSSASSTNCSSAGGCEFKIWDISTPSAPAYQGGADASGGTNSGTGSVSMNDIVVSGTNAYTVSTGDSTDCSSAIGCELKAWDISTPSAPSYQGGGNATGATNSGGGFALSARNISISDSYVFTTWSGNATACSNPLGCELKIWDISNPAAPTYAAGGDVGGTVNTGGSSVGMNGSYIVQDHIYTTTDGSATNCASAVGCEMQMWDISVPTAPVYVAGGDSGGASNSGTGSITANDVFVFGDNAFLASNGNSGNCASSIIGCEFKIWQVLFPRALTKPPNNLGLVGYWSFNDGAGTVAGDFSGRGFHGTLETGDESTLPQWIHGKRGKALNFSNVYGDFVSLGNTLDIPTLPLSFSGWIRLDPGGVGSHRAIINKRDSFADEAMRFQVHVDTAERITLEHPTGGVVFDGYIVPSGQWVHIAVVASSTGSALYVNGVHTDQEGAYTLGADATAPVFIGSNPDLDDFMGDLDEIRLYNRALGASEIAALYGQGTGASGAVEVGASTVTLQQGSTLKDGLVGHWTLDGPDTHSTIADRSGEGNDGYFLGGATSSAKTAGILGQALDFSGAADYIDLGDVLDLVGSSMTLCGWIKPTDAAGIGYLAGKFSFDTQNGWFIRQDSADWRFGTDGSNFVIASGAVDLNQWQHLCLVANPAPATTYGYKNGVQVGTSDTSPALADNPYSATIGDSYSGLRPFTGSIDDVRIYNRALTAREVQQLYNLGQTTVRP